MDPNTRALMMGAAGAGGGEKIYVEDVFSTYLYTGNNSTQTITNGIDLSGKGGLAWIKSRSSASWDNWLFDSSNSFGQGLSSNQTGGRSNAAIDSVSSAGFTVKAGFNSVNENATTYASWTFREAPKFFDVVTYTGTGSTQAIPHNLGSVPGMYICKSTSSTGDWSVYHRGLSGANKFLMLNSTAAETTSGSYWDSQAPTADVFYVGNNNVPNANGVTYVAYVFAHDAGGFGNTGNDSVVKCGSFTTTTSGAVVDLGWEPQFILFKRSDGTGSWEIIDSMRGASLSDSSRLFPNLSAAETTAGAAYVYPTATGFVVDGPNRPFTGTGIYIAIRRGPMKTPTDATKVFYQLARTGTAADTTITGAGFPPDAHLNSVRNVTNNGFNALFLDKLRGPNIFLIPLSTDAESSSINTLNSFNQDGVTYGAGSNINSNTKNYINWMFRRAPGFFDVVAYTGTGSVQSISHNLGVTPELMIVKARNLSGLNWPVYSASTGNTNWLRLNTTDASASATGMWNSTSPTASVFTVGTSAASNDPTGTFIAYLFASCPGVSKVGSYTGTGTTLQINCGFTAGARFVMIKRTDSAGDWYVWDTARGIISGNDPYLLLNSTAAEVTGTDYIDPLSSGFEISSTAPAAINANGGSFIFLAVA